MKIRK